MADMHGKYQDADDPALFLPGRRRAASDDEDETPQRAPPSQKQSLKVTSTKQRDENEAAVENLTEMFSSSVMKPGQDWAEEEMESIEPKPREKKQPQPFDVPTTGAFWLHDDRFDENSNTEKMQPKPRKEKQENEGRWLHDKFDTLEEDSPDEPRGNYWPRRGQRTRGPRRPDSSRESYGDGGRLDRRQGSQGSQQYSARGNPQADYQNSGSSAGGPRGRPGPQDYDYAYPELGAASNSRRGSSRPFDQRQPQSMSSQQRNGAQSYHPDQSYNRGATGAPQYSSRDLEPEHVRGAPAAVEDSGSRQQRRYSTMAGRIAQGSGSAANNMQAINEGPGPMNRQRDFEITDEPPPGMSIHLNARAPAFQPALQQVSRNTSYYTSSHKGGGGSQGSYNQQAPYLATSPPISIPQGVVYDNMPPLGLGLTGPPHSAKPNNRGTPPVNTYNREYAYEMLPAPY